MATRASVLAGLCLLPLTFWSCSDAGFNGSNASPQAQTNTNTSTSTENDVKAPPEKPAPTSTNTSSSTSSLGNSQTGNPANSPQIDTTPPSNAVTQGHFTVWATPTDPQPYQDYQIYLKVNLPAGTTNYQESDLSGQVQGTDGYVQPLNMSVQHQTVGGQEDPSTLTQVTPQFAVQGNQAQLMIWVPGAQAHVNDTVTVSSTLLNETQTIQIHFQ